MEDLPSTNLSQVQPFITNISCRISKVVLTFESVIEILAATIQNYAFLQHDLSSWAVINF